MRPVNKGVLGQRFGMLTVSARVPATAAERGHWLCACDCGASTKVRDSSHLVDGKRLSCGCSRPRKRADYRQPGSSIDVTGMRFGILTAVKRVETAVRRQGSVWLFKCDCGTAALVRLKDARNGNTASCGCMKQYRGKFVPLLDINRPWRKDEHVDDRWLVLLGQRSPVVTT